MSILGPCGSQRREWFARIQHMAGCVQSGISWLKHDSFGRLNAYSQGWDDGSDYERNKGRKP